MTVVNSRRVPYFTESGRFRGAYRCELHEWDFEEGDYCPVCHGENLAKLKMLEMLEVGNEVEAIITDYWSDDEYDKDDALEAIRGLVGRIGTDE
jgi:hypothetical protein